MRPHGAPNQRYLLPSPIQKKFAKHWYRTSNSLFFFNSYLLSAYHVTDTLLWGSNSSDQNRVSAFCST